MKEEQSRSFRELSPEIPEEEIEEAEARFDRYLEIVARIYARVYDDAKFLEILEASESEEESNSD